MDFEQQRDTLGYEPAARMRRRRHIRRTVWLLAVLGAVALAVHYHRPLVAHVRLRLDVRECLRWKVPPTTPIAEHDRHLAAAALVASDPQRYRLTGYHEARMRVPAMTRVCEAALGWRFTEPWLVHRLIVDGHERLIVFWGDSGIRGRTWSTASFMACVIDPGPFWGRPREICSGQVDGFYVYPSSAPPRIFGGETDASDPSVAHYPYQQGGRSGHIRIQLLRDGRITMVPEDGPLRELYDQYETGTLIK